MAHSNLDHWLTDPDGGLRSPEIARAISAHPADCASLRHVWLPTRDGVSCLSDITFCAACDVTFFNEGIYDGKCECCARP